MSDVSLFYLNALVQSSKLSLSRLFENVPVCLSPGEEDGYAFWKLLLWKPFKAPWKHELNTIHLHIQNGHYRFYMGNKYNISDPSFWGFKLTLDYTKCETFTDFLIYEECDFEHCWVWEEDMNSMEGEWFQVKGQYCRFM